jgi:protein tyrosine phosphatase (PTP) superfamily phosphohydrolase (DUF442 family)
MTMPLRLVLGVAFAALLAGCQTQPPTAPPGRTATTQEPELIEAAGLHNVLRISENLYSGSSPEGEEGFRSLRRLGVRTVISVDGARPDVEMSRKFGMRYVHLPVGYDGVPRERALQLARAVRDLPGPVYVHCHHGQHRGPTAAVAAELCLDGSCSVERAEAVLKKAGTDPRYKGLVGLPRSLKRPSPGELDQASTDFPEVAVISDLARHMVEIDDRFENLKLVRKAGWRQPPDHPDVDPPHEALLLAEHYREAARLDLPERPEELRRWLKDAEARATDLEQLLRSAKGKGPVDGEAAEAAFKQIGAGCAQCHAKYRDVPR